MGFILHNFYGKAAAAFMVRTQTLRIVTCDNIITLHADIIGFAGNAKFRWEQVSGQPVAFLEDQNQVTVTFQQPAIRDDKVFAFYVNKGTSLEQRYLVTVTAVPRETVYITNDLYSTAQPFTSDELAAVSASPGLVYDGLARYIDFSNPADLPLFSYIASRYTNSLVLATYSYGVRTPIVNPSPALSPGQRLSTMGIVPFDRNAVVYLEQGVALSKTDPPSWVMKQPTALIKNPGVSVVEKANLGNQIHSSSNTIGELFITRTSLAPSEKVGITASLTSVSTVVQEFFLTRDSTQASEKLSLNNSLHSTSVVTATNFIDKSSIG